MYLSAYITDQFITSVILKKDPIEVLNLDFVKLPYIAETVKRPLTLDKITESLTNSFNDFLVANSIKFNDLEKIFIVDSQYPTDIKPSLDINEILGRIPHNVIQINQFSPQMVEFVSDKYINDFLNYTNYKLNLPKDIKLQADLTYLTYYINNNIDKIYKNSNIIVMSPLKYSEFKILEYATSIVKQFANVTKKPQVYTFNIDYAYSLVPLVGALIKLNINVEQFFKENPLDPDAKLIVAPEVERYEIHSNTLSQLNQRKKTETINLRPNSLNIIQLKENEKISINYKSKYTKFSGSLTGSRTDVYFDNRKLEDK